MSGQEVYRKTPEEWEYHRGVITHLYLHKTRHDMMQIMEGVFGFRATTSMYSNKLKEWGVKKNYSARGKDMLAMLALGALANGQDPSQMVFQGQSVNHHRILRHLRERDRKPSSTTVSTSLQLHSPTTDHQLDALVNVLDGPVRNFGEKSSRELILLSTKAYIQSFLAGCSVDYRSPVQPFPSQAGGSPGSGVLLHVRANQFWHDFETAVYLLRIGSIALGWSTFHACWETAAENFLPQPITLIRKVLTTLHPHGGLRKFPEVSHSAPAFISDLLEMKLGPSHPLVQICRHVRHDKEGPSTAESTLALMRGLLEESLGPYHHETFQTSSSLITRHSQNGDFVSAENAARKLVQNSEFSPEQGAQLPVALRLLAHVLTKVGRYGDAITIQEGILNIPGIVIPEDLRIYTMEDIAELQRFKGDLFMESKYLGEAFLAAREFFGPDQAPTLHIWDKFAASMSEQERDFEGV